MRRDRCQCGCCPTQWQSPCNPTPNFSLGLSAGSQTRLCAISALGPAARVIAAGATGKAGHIGYRKWFNGKLCVNEMAAYLYFRAGTGRRPTVFASELAKTFGWSRPTGRCPSSLIPHSPPHRRRSASRDFVPWRFSDASRQRAWRGSSCRCPRTLYGAIFVKGVPARVLSIFSSLSFFVRPGSPFLRPDPRSMASARAGAFKDGALAPTEKAGP